MCQRKLQSCTPKKEDPPQARVSTETIVEALEANNGNVCAATRWIKKKLNIQITHQAISKRVHKNEKLREVRNDSIEVYVDEAEDVVAEEVHKGNLTAAIFVLKTLGRKRGYSQSVEAVISNPPGETFKTEEEIVHIMKPEALDDLAKIVTYGSNTNSGVS